MERALVIFESMFGNTRKIAEAMADGLTSRFVTDLIEVGLAPTRIAEDVSLVVVGGPTHAFGSVVRGPVKMRQRRRTNLWSLRRAASASGLTRSSGHDSASTPLRSTPASTSRACRVPPHEAQKNVSVVWGSESLPPRRAST